MAVDVLKRDPEKHAQREMRMQIALVLIRTLKAVNVVPSNDGCRLTGVSTSNSAGVTHHKPFVADWDGEGYFINYD